MIITNIIGGLGNQMFQYACGRSLSLRTGHSLRLATDQFEGYSLHNGFELQRAFNIQAPLATEAEIRDLLGWLALPTVRRLVGRRPMRWVSGGRLTIEPHFHYWPKFPDLSGPLYLQGYWQSERYFQQCAEKIRADFTFQMEWDAADDAVRVRMRAQPSVSIHIRRGDYTAGKNKAVFAQCDLDYYRAAIRLVRKRVPHARLFAFSDDPAWVEEHLGHEFAPIELIRHNTGARAANDMRLMSQADHHIIANSSFSWWGAWLNPSREKIVVAPRRWFVDGKNDEDLIPSTWIRL